MQSSCVLHPPGIRSLRLRMIDFLLPGGCGFAFMNPREDQKHTSDDSEKGPYGIGSSSSFAALTCFLWSFLIAFLRRFTPCATPKCFDE